MNESPAAAHLNLSSAGSKTVDLGAVHRDTGGTKEARLRVLLYGRLADAIGRQIEVEAAERCSVGELRRELASRHPAAAETLHRSRACVRSELVPDDHQLTAEDDLELLPPVSGG